MWPDRATAVAASRPNHAVRGGRQQQEDPPQAAGEELERRVQAPLCSRHRQLSRLDGAPEPGGRDDADRPDLSRGDPRPLVAARGRLRPGAAHGRAGLTLAALACAIAQSRPPADASATPTMAARSDAGILQPNPVRSATRPECRVMIQLHLSSPGCAPQIAGGNSSAACSRAPLYMFVSETPTVLLLDRVGPRGNLICRLHDADSVAWGYALASSRCGSSNRSPDQPQGALPQIGALRPALATDRSTRLVWTRPASPSLAKLAPHLRLPIQNRSVQLDAVKMVKHYLAFPQIAAPINPKDWVKNQPHSACLGTPKDRNHESSERCGRNCCDLYSLRHGRSGRPIGRYSSGGP